MGKRKEDENLNEREQANKKHRKKSKKLEKREKLKKNQKKTKQEKHKIRKLLKFVKNYFKDNKKEIDLNYLPFNFEEVKEIIGKLLEIDENSIEAIPSLFQTMEETHDEVDLKEMEDKKSQKYLVKLMKSLKVEQNVRNQFAFRINKILRDNRGPRQKFTENVEELIQDNMESYYLFVKAVFLYVSYEKKQAEVESGQGKPLGDGSDDNDDDDDLQMRDEDENSDDSDDLDENKGKAKYYNEDNDNDDEDYRRIEQTLGNNSDLINRAFNKMLQNDKKSTKLNINTLNNNDKEAEQEQENNENDDDDDDDELVGPPIPTFLQQTMNLIQNNNEKETDDDLVNLINKTSSTRTKKQNTNKNQPISKFEPINKETYDQILIEERERMKEMEEYLDSEEQRGPSLLEMHQRKKDDKKNKTDIQDFMLRSFDRDKDITGISSTKALKVIKEQKGLDKRFESKEKYLGY